MSRDHRDDADNEPRGGNFYTDGDREDGKNIEYLQINDRDLTDLERSHSDEDQHLIEEDNNNAKSAQRTTNSTNNLTDQ